eukprot:222429-Chlamydomonas_euryale.AAC.4
MRVPVACPRARACGCPPACRCVHSRASGRTSIAALNRKAVFCHLRQHASQHRGQALRDLAGLDGDIAGCGGAGQQQPHRRQKPHAPVRRAAHGGARVIIRLARCPGLPCHAVPPPTLLPDLTTSAVTQPPSLLTHRL